MKDFLFTLLVGIGIFGLIFLTVYGTYRLIKFFDPKCDQIEGDIWDRW
jgi:hypothetical protein